MNSARLRAELALAAVTVIWGWSFVIVKKALEDLPTFLFLALRFGVASFTLVLLFRGRLGQHSHRWKETLRAGLVTGLCLASGYFFQTAGLRYTTASKSAFLTGLTMAVVPFLAAAVSRKPPQLSELFGVAVAVTGMALLTLPPGTFSMAWGDTLTLGCTLAFAAHVVAVGYWSSRTAWELLTLTQIFLTGLLSFVLAWGLEPMEAPWNLRIAGAVLFTGVLATAIPFSVQCWAQSFTTPTRTALIFALEPVTAAVAAYFWAGERLSVRGWLGATLILCGVLLVELKPWRGRSHPLA